MGNNTENKFNSWWKNLISRKVNVLSKNDGEKPVKKIKSTREIGYELHLKCDHKQTTTYNPDSLEEENQIFEALDACMKKFTEEFSKAGDNDLLTFNHTMFKKSDFVKIAPFKRGEY